MELLIFYAFCVGAVVSALLMVTTKRPVRAAMSLVATMSFLAGLYALLNAHLIAVLQLIVYAGAIMVLFLFVIMLLNIEEKEGKLAKNVFFIQLAGTVVVGILMVAMVVVMNKIGAPVAGAAVDETFGTTKAVGWMLFTKYLLPFEIASVLLLAAIVGAVILAKRRIDNSKA